jgi:hypothetical protein
LQTEGLVPVAVTVAAVEVGIERGFKSRVSTRERCLIPLI